MYARYFPTLQPGICFSRHRVVGLTCFKTCWREHLGNLLVARPMTDLCWVCKQNTRKLQSSSVQTMEARAAVVKLINEHQEAYTKERSYYNHCVKEATDAAKALGVTALQPCRPNSVETTMHYSFDYAQQVHLPHCPMQPGPIYFLVPRKCGLFGINCEALPRQINNCIDEGECVGKGSNSVISYLHHFFDNFSIGERHVTLHCDNCAGQNKNQFMLQYLAWRLITGRHTSVSLHFMLPGHTKFAPDWCFGLLKRSFRKAEVHCLDDLATVINSATKTGINRAMLVGDEAGNVAVPTYDWQSFFN